ncbi:hypothetical protein WA158_003162 [Blastocystis sp. Blastoise]
MGTQSRQIHKKTNFKQHQISSSEYNEKYIGYSKSKNKRITFYNEMDKTHMNIRVEHSIWYIDGPDTFTVEYCGINRTKEYYLQFMEISPIPSKRNFQLYSCQSEKDELPFTEVMAICLSRFQ